MPSPLQTSQVLFREEQQFRQPWLWALLLGGLAVALAATLPMLLRFQHHPWPASFWLSLIFPSVFMLLVCALFLYISMVTEVRSDGISVSFRPFQMRPQFISYSNIANFEAVTYRPIAEYGGWGIKWGRAGKAYSVSGNLGLLLTLKDGKTFLIGSQQPERLKAAVDSIIKR